MLSSDESMKKMTRSHQALEKTNFTQKSDSSLRALSTASDLMQKLSLCRQKISNILSTNS